MNRPDDGDDTSSASRDVVDAMAPILAQVAARAPAVDAGQADVRRALAELGSAGLLGLGLPGGGHGTLADQAAVLRLLAGKCTATAFAAWAQRTTVGYLAGWAGPEVRANLLQDLLAGRRAGATAMAIGYQARLGLRELTVTATPVEGGLVLDGVVPWASNLFGDGAVVVLPARSTDGRTLIVVTTTDQPGMRRQPYPPLLALGATASTTLQLDAVAVEHAQVLTEKFETFLDRMRPGHLLLQTALAMGLADVALDAAAQRLTGTGELFADDHRALEATRTRLDTQAAIHLARPRRAGPALVRLRLEASQLAVAATRHESTLAGGAGYLATSATARRLREATFLPIQSPTEAQLRWELTRSA